ncbi:CDP-alcohol phosphatidyltransferase family protein [Ruania suaedae]|uniref:phosphatidylinositol phosphate synthase n=1 Tax=Ruania suaedae TaxID=2897774 RepID=UPI001E3DB071|nr:CDP-alcohol phosphatidyltransferase family protein [Ruania suaedae]UFU01585.1 CDP-alcohol phosphatidyltransferase family protein [Ruania suaedae]
MVLGNRGRSFTNALFGPLARGLVRAGVSANVVTVAGTVATSATALWLLPPGHLVVGVAVVVVLAFADSIDGLMARERGGGSAFGAYLDSTMDRVSDAAIFTALGLYLLGQDEQRWQGVGFGLAMACVMLGMLVSYARARAEGLGISARAGIAERTDRLVFAGAATLAVGLGAPVLVLVIALGVLAIANIVTVVQRSVVVYRAPAGGGQA